MVVDTVKGWLGFETKQEKKENRLEEKEDRQRIERERLLENGLNLETLQLESYAKQASIREAYKNFAQAKELNVLIRDLKLMNPEIMAVLNRSVSYLGTNLKADKNMRFKAVNCFKEIKIHLEIMKDVWKEVGDKGKLVPSFNGIEGLGAKMNNLELLAQKFLEQISANKIKWKPEDVKAYADAIDSFSQTIDQIEFGPTSIPEIVQNLANSSGKHEMN